MASNPNNEPSPIVRILKDGDHGHRLVTPTGERTNMTRAEAEKAMDEYYQHLRTIDGFLYGRG